MPITEIDDEGFSKFSEWLCRTELSNFSDLRKLIDYELNSFDEWHSSIKATEEKLLKKQEELSKKENLTPSDEYILSLDITDILSEEDYDNINFEEDILQMLIIKIYTKIEQTIKLFYSQKQHRKLNERYKEWVSKFNDELGISFNTLPGYIEFQTLRLFNNNLKHSGVLIGIMTANDIFDYNLLEILKDDINEETYNKLLHERDKTKFAEKITLLSLHIKPSKDKIIFLYEQSY